LWTHATAAGVRCHPLHIRNAVDIAAGVRLRAILRRNRFDIVHFHTSRAHAMAPFARGFSSALVVTRRMDYRPNRIFAPYLFNRAVDSVIAISGGVADSLALAGVDAGRVAVVPSGVDCEHFRPPDAGERATARSALGIDENAIVISALGALEPRKGHRHLVDAIAAMVNSGSKSSATLRCMIAGHGSLRAELERQAAQLGCARNVTLLGRIEDARGLLWASDIFAMPSLNEGLGVAALEAMACGLPAVLTRVGGLRETVKDTVTGFVVAPASPADLASALANLAAAPELRARTGAAARALVEEKFSMAAMAAGTLALYRASLNKARGEQGGTE
ncbi:MAG TPA: glycosyltransferase, partial [Candidatus Acidoferrales bacterium]|nr:glycosyltransferase [Candidatus Acidoferrales bacterium]